MQALLTVDQLSIYLQKSVASIRSDVTRNPLALPPICRLPGTKRLLWRVEDVEQWLAEHVVSVDIIASTVPQEKTRRGRPSKAEQVSRQRRLVR
ncbi:DNA-binding protein [Pseudomonas aeruginosa]|uniref:DNA-binding protein n=1 Tax=Pseudomonas aeruginosa TaxID=287 RepID=UPI000DEF75CB|nr:DNA-binding protein [Pseudomonas aeruginosa]MCT5883145.1 DNA-binding protein [Pseudomonas aeruginosa]HCF3677929.1 DNA-binding protein [Pseudomonas aeruginosa]